MRKVDTTVSIDYSGVLYVLITDLNSVWLSTHLADLREISLLLGKKVKEERRRKPINHYSVIL